MNTLAQIADRYWLVRDEWANTVGVVVRIADIYIAHYRDQLPTTLANIAAVAEYVQSDTAHTLDLRLTPELVTKLAMHSSNL